jgi:hypothetical protein
MVTASTLRRHASIKPQGSRFVLSAIHPAITSARTIFASRVFDPSEVARVLKDGHQSRKIGKMVVKGARRGWPIFTLTLEERATCPRTCQAFSYCYGNSMQAAERIVAGPELEAVLWTELTELQRKSPRGFMVRLHVLGDFYSLGYVRLWKRALAAFPALHVFGFTARDPRHDEIGIILRRMVETDWSRFAVRFSGMAGPMLGSQLMPDHHVAAIQCPAQTEAADCCASCALCWHSKRSIAFAKH